MFKIATYGLVNFPILFITNLFLSWRYKIASLSSN